MEMIAGTESHVGKAHTAAKWRQLEMMQHQLRHRTSGREKSKTAERVNQDEEPGKWSKEQSLKGLCEGEAAKSKGTGEGSALVKPEPREAQRHLYKWGTWWGTGQGLCWRDGRIFPEPACARLEKRWPGWKRNQDPTFSNGRMLCLLMGVKGKGNAIESVNVGTWIWVEWSKKSIL